MSIASFLPCYIIATCLIQSYSAGGAVMVSLSPSGIPQEDADKKFNYGALYALGGAGL